jgi:hypothetical protein
MWIDATRRRDEGDTMIWTLLALLGVPLWLCAIAIVTLILRNRELRHRPGNVPVRRRLPGKKQGSRSHGVWVGDVLAFRGSPAAWQESLLYASSGDTGTSDHGAARAMSTDPTLAGGQATAEFVTATA